MLKETIEKYNGYVNRERICTVEGCIGRSGWEDGKNRYSLLSYAYETKGCFPGTYGGYGGG
jgi:hypothetical protein